MEKLVLYLVGSTIKIQREDYIEDGWYILITGNKISLYEIPQGGGEPIIIGQYNTLLDAIQYAKSLI